MDLNEGGAAQAPGDFCVSFSFYVIQHLEHPARTGLPGAQEDGESRMVGQGEAGCWQQLCRSGMETADSCMMSEVCPHRCDTQNTLTASTGKGGYP